MTETNTKMYIYETYTAIPCKPNDDLLLALPKKEEEKKTKEIEQIIEHGNQYTDCSNQRRVKFNICNSNTKQAKDRRNWNVKIIEQLVETKVGSTHTRKRKIALMKINQ
ncbi:uncharacterized protein LOC144411836 [Styela clava]